MEDYNENDVKFAQDMIIHHQLAVEMAAELLQNGLNAGLKDLCNNIIDAQTSEIKFLKKWLTDRGEKLPKTGSKMKM